MASPRLAGVLGHPVGHSKSPLIHNHWLKTLGLSGLYAPIDVEPSRFEDWLRLAPELGFVGFNVTIPHKRAAYEAATRRTDRAKRAGSVNTLWWETDGALWGDSTDGFGFHENLRERDPGVTVEGARVALLGAGGAARAVAAELIDSGAAQLAIYNRTVAKAEELTDLDPTRVTAHAWPPSAEELASADLLINGTSLGMEGQPPLELAWPRLKPNAVATDLVYAPLRTPFLIAAERAGAATVDGLGMLLHQARPGFERWFGATPTVDARLREIVLDKEGYLP